MPKGRGGKRTPKDPAPVSGPGALSQRTDGGPAQPIRPVPAEGREFGSRQESVELQQAAALPAPETPSPPPGGGQGTVPPTIEREVDPFGPSRRPGEPITTGAAPLPVGDPSLDPDLGVYRDPQVLGALELLASQPGASAASRQFVRKIIASLPPEPRP